VLPLEEGNKHSCPSRFRAKSTRAKRKRKRVGGNKEERERKKERQSLVVVVLVRRKRRSILFDGKKKKKCGTKLCLRLEFWPLGKRISLISRSVAFTAYVETEKAEREDEKPTLSTKR
jgi:hypothetical protein